MNFKQESKTRVLGTIAAMLTVLTLAFVMNIETGRSWAIVGLVTIAGAAVLLHLTKPLALTTSEAISNARR